MNIKIFLVACTVVLLSGCVETSVLVPWSMEEWTQTENKVIDSGGNPYTLTRYAKDGRERGHFVKLNGDFDLWYEQEEGWDE